MLKKLRVLFLGLVVLAGSACVTPTHASSASSPILTYVQAAGASGAREELVVIYNPTSTPIDITNWCLINKSGVKFACFTPPTAEPTLEYTVILPPGGYATVASQEYGATRSVNYDAFTVMYTVTHSVNGSITGSSDIISLIDSQSTIRDSYGWTTALQSGKAISRLLLISQPVTYAMSGSPSDWIVSAPIPFPVNDASIESNEIIPGNPTGSEGGATQSSLRITEILANPAGVDTGHEFIELFNSNLEQAVLLDGIKLRIGQDSAKWYLLPHGVTVPPGQYIVFTDTDLGYSLVNTSGGVQLYSGDEPLGERVTYISPKDDMVWALIDGVWQYSSFATPGGANKLPEKIEASAANRLEANGEPSLKACAENQYRNPDTGRCKRIVSTTSAAISCEVGQERNPATNRCRKVEATSSLSPCKEGQERSAETNRCRSIKKMSTAEHGIKGVQQNGATQLSWYYIAAIVGVILLIVGYAIWEWREELRRFWRYLRARFAKR